MKEAHPKKTAYIFKRALRSLLVILSVTTIFAAKALESRHPQAPIQTASASSSATAAR